MPRTTPKDILELVPHIVKRYYDENGREIGWVADNFVVKTQEEVDEILKEIGKIWGESCARRAREAALKNKGG